MEQEINTKDDDIGNEKNSLLPSAMDPTLVQKIAASLMNEEWFKEKLTEKISQELALNSEHVDSACVMAANGASTVGDNPMRSVNSLFLEEEDHDHDLSCDESEKDDILEIPHDRHRPWDEQSYEEQNLKAFVPGEDRFCSDDDIRADNKFLKADNKFLKSRLKAVEGKLGTLGMQLLDLVKSQEKIGAAQDQKDDLCSLSQPECEEISIGSRGFLSLPISAENDTFNEMPHDTYSFMIIAEPRSRSWCAGSFTFVSQMLLSIMIASHQIGEQSKGSSIFNVPFKVNFVVRMGQFLGIVFCVSTESDIITSIQSLNILWKNTRWDVIVLGRHPSEHRLGINQWKWHILFPNVAKFIQGFAVVFVSFVVILQSDNVIDLFKDFTALAIISTLDNSIFHLAAAGYLGRELLLETSKVQKIDLRLLGDPLESDSIKKEQCTGFLIRPVILAVLVVAMTAGWLTIVILQETGYMFEKRFPDCTADYQLARKHIGDGICYGGRLNTIGCEFEGGDCINFNLEYPLCRGDDLINLQEEIGNGTCNPTFNTEECSFDGNDCCHVNITKDPSFGDGSCDFDLGKGSNTEKCLFDGGDCLTYKKEFCKQTDAEGDLKCCPLEIVNSTRFRDGQCNGGEINTELCSWDGGDCDAFSKDHRECPLEEISNIKGSEGVMLGDGICDNYMYNTALCGYENGDCAVGQIGQDLISSDSVLNSKNNFIHFQSLMSKDGSTIAIAYPQTFGTHRAENEGRVVLYRYNTKEKLWIRISDIVGEFAKERFGLVMAFSQNGSRVVISAPHSKKNGINSGTVKVFDIHFDKNDYRTIEATKSVVQVGQTLIGGARQERLGRNIDITADGARLAISSPFSDDRGENAGKIQFFDLVASGGKTKWIKMESGILGEENERQEVIGHNFVKLNSTNGTIVIFSVGKSAEASSTTRIYAFNATSQEWDKVGNNEIPSPHVAYGSSAAISADGHRIAIAFNTTNNAARGGIQILGYNETTKSYDHIGEKIYKTEDSRVGDGFAHHISMSSDGNMLAVNSIDLECGKGGPNNEFCATGSVDLFTFNVNERKFYGMTPKIVRNSNTNGDRNIIKELERTRGLSVFGRQMTIGENESGDVLLSINGYNFNSDDGYVKVYNLTEQFYPNCGVLEPVRVGDERCQIIYNNEECGWDGGDCELYNSFENCDVSEAHRIGDENCDNELPYNSTECGLDGGDCENRADF